MIRDYDRYAARDQRLRGRHRRVRPGNLLVMALLLILVIVGILFIMLRFAHA